MQLKKGDLLLEDARTLEDQGVKNDDVVMMAYRVDNTTFEVRGETVLAKNLCRQRFT